MVELKMFGVHRAFSFFPLRQKPLSILSLVKLAAYNAIYEVILHVPLSFFFRSPATVSAGKKWARDANFHT
jgi:hypothetical protein